MSFASTIAELTQQQGRDAAEARRDAARIAAQALTSNAEAASRAAGAKVAIWGNAISNIGQSIAQIPQEINRGKVLDLQRQEMESQVEERKAQTAKIQQQQAENQAVDRAFQESIDPVTGLVDQNKAMAKLPGSVWSKYQPVFDAHNKSVKAVQDAKDEQASELFYNAWRTGDPGVLMAGAKLGSAAFSPEESKQIQQLATAAANAPEEHQAETVKTLAAQVGGHLPGFVKRLDSHLTQEAGLKKTLAETEAANALTAQRSRLPEPKEISVAPGHTVLRDGQPVYTAPDKEPTPAKPTPFTLSPGEVRYDETGNPIASRPPKPEKADKPAAPRKVLSSDANKIADINSSIKEAAALKKMLESPGDTGTLSQIGSMLPNFVNEGLGGVGSESKMRLAQIALVRQIIGKGLEGGVLRKEDEIKYKAILPTIGDAPEVVKSKLEQLDTTLRRKRDDHLESLADVGFDVEALKAHAPAVEKSERVRVKGPNGQTGTVPSGTSLPPGWSFQ